MAGGSATAHVGTPKRKMAANSECGPWHASCSSQSPCGTVACWGPTVRSLSLVSRSLLARASSLLSLRVARAVAPRPAEAVPAVHRAAVKVHRGPPPRRPRRTQERAPPHRAARRARGERRRGRAQAFPCPRSRRSAPMAAAWAARMSFKTTSACCSSSVPHRPPFRAFATSRFQISANRAPTARRFAPTMQLSTAIASPRSARPDRLPPRVPVRRPVPLAIQARAAGAEQQTDARALVAVTPLAISSARPLVHPPRRPARRGQHARSEVAARLPPLSGPTVAQTAALAMQQATFNARPTVRMHRLPRRAACKALPVRPTRDAVEDSSVDARRTVPAIRAATCSA
jgi:hypothetical protein